VNRPRAKIIPVTLIVAAPFLVFNPQLGCGDNRDRTPIEQPQQRWEQDERCVDYKVGLVETSTLKLADLEYGRGQVDIMLAQRPAMATIVKQGDVVYEWAAKRYGGRSCGVRIRWSDTSPREGFPAENAYPAPDRGGEIRIGAVHPDGSAISPQELWCYAVYELFNIANGPAWLELERLAIDNKLGRTEFVEKSALLEWCAAKKTRDFYELLWIPFASEGHFEPGETAWNRLKYPTFRAWKRSWGRLGYPYSIYGTYYDTLKK